MTKRRGDATWKGDTAYPPTATSALKQEMSGDGPADGSSSKQEMTRIQEETNIPLLSTLDTVTNVPLSGATETNMPVFVSSPSPSARPSSSALPSLSHSQIPSSWPTKNPSTAAPTPAPFLPLAFGEELSWTDDDLGIEVSSGLSVKVVAMTGRSVIYGDGNKSSNQYHAQMDGAGIVPLQDGGYVYVSNSELEGNAGGMSFA